MFEQFDLDSALLGGIQNAGYKKPTSIQELVLPAAMTGKDILASAPTGTGKTAAFILPIAQHLLDFLEEVLAFHVYSSCHPLVNLPCKPASNVLS